MCVFYDCGCSVILLVCKYDVCGYDIILLVYKCDVCGCNISAVCVQQLTPAMESLRIK